MTHEYRKDYSSNFSLGNGSGDLRTGLLNIELGYPASKFKELPEAASLFKFIKEKRSEADDLESMSREERYHQGRRIANFFDIYSRTPIYIVSSAGLAVTGVTEVCGKPESKVYVTEGSYPLENFGKSLPGRGKEFIRISNDNLRYISRNEDEKAIILSERLRSETFPRQAHQHTRSPIMKYPDNIVVVDALNSCFGEDTRVIRDTEGNRLQRSYVFPLSNDVIIEGTSKLFTHGRIPNVAIIGIAEEIASNFDEALQFFVDRNSYDTPSGTELWLMAEVLHSEEMTKYHEAVNKLADLNNRYVATQLEGITEVIPEGLNVWVKVFERCNLTPAEITRKLLSWGLKARHSREFDTTGYDRPVLIRFPILIDDIELKTAKLKEIIKKIKDYNVGTMP